MTSPKSILIANIRLIGDVILTTPLIGLLHDAYPGAAIDLVVNRKTGEFLEKDPRVRQVIYSEAIDVEKNARVRGKGYARRIFRRYDLAVNMNASDRGNFAVLLAGKGERVGFYPAGGGAKGLWQRLLFTHPLPFPDDIHIVQLCARVAEALGIPVPRLEARVFWDEGDERKVTSLLTESGCGGPYCVIHPFARWRYKYWDLDRFVELSDLIAGRFALRPVWTSSPHPDEVALLQEAARRCRTKPVTVPGALDLNQMTFLLARASLYVGLDTAVSHLAATTGIPMVALFGPTPVGRWGPWDNGADPFLPYMPGRGGGKSGPVTVVQTERECVPCGKMGCIDKYHDSDCLTEIGTDAVLAAVTDLMVNGVTHRGRSYEAK